MLRALICSGLLVISAALSTPAQAFQHCGDVTILRMLAGPRHGSMMLVSNPSCGPAGGWICLDPDPQFMSPEKSRRLHAFLMAQYLTKGPVNLSVHEGTFASACQGPYPIVEDARTGDGPS
jgi:hypothetical protein